MKKEVFRIIPKPKAKAPRWVVLFFYGSLILVALSAGLFFFLQDRVLTLEKERETLQAQIVDVESRAQTIFTKELLDASKKIGDFSRIFQEHKNTSKLFDFLRASCHPKAQFTSLTLDSENYQVDLSGKTENFQSLGEQLIVFRNNKDVKELQLSNISFDVEGQLNFNLTFVLAETIFKDLSKNSSP